MSASLVYNHYRQKSLEERVQRRVVRRDAWFDDRVGTNVTGDARRAFVRKEIEKELAAGFLTNPRGVELQDTTAREFFAEQVEAEYNSTRTRHGLLHSC